MARFVRDEKRIYPFAWLMIGGVFALSTFWAVYAEFVTRVPWQVHQEGFFDLEYAEAQANLDREQKRWDAIAAAEPTKTLLARLAELDAQKSGGDYAAAAARLVELEQDFKDAEVEKTFGASDLDETYFYRNLAEYERDAAQVEVRRVYKASYPGDPVRAASEPNAIYRDPPAQPQNADETDLMFHLRTEVARMTAHAVQAEQAMKSGHPPALIAALQASIEKERGVVTILEREQQHQTRIDAAENAMRAIAGPDEPHVDERGSASSDPNKLDAAVAAARAQACQDEPDTISCIKWLKLGPLDQEHKQLTISVSKAKRGLIDAELRYANAKDKADPTLDLGNPMKALIGPFQIEQIVLSWMDAERDVDLQQVDRCHTCHMGADKPLYTASSIVTPFRTHPRRGALMKSHPIDKFGCTACHQGQGRSTDMLAHSKWVLEVKHGHEQWHYEGDHYWEDPLLPNGTLSKIIIDEHNDTLEVKLQKGDALTLVLDHVYPTKNIDEDEMTEKLFFEQLQTKLQTVLDADAALKQSFKAVAEVVDNRVVLGFAPIDPNVTADKSPKVTITFPKPGLAKMLGFGHTRQLESRAETLFTAPAPMVQPVRAATPRADGSIVDVVGGDYAYLPPLGSYGLQVTDDMRSRLIAALPEIEAGCLRCHHADADLVPHRSQFEHVERKLAFEKAEAAIAADPVAYQEEHGNTEPPTPVEAAGELPSLAPTLDAGRQLFRQVNCTGCHLLEGYDNNPDQGPALDHISAKVTPEWLLTWLRDPRGWRAKTSMPNLWPRPLDPASKLPYGEGSPEHSKWMAERTEETLAIAAYLIQRSEAPATRPSGTGGDEALRAKIAGYAEVPGANAELGKKVFEASGCQGCHATIEGGRELPAAWRARERDIAPTLSNLKHKVNADWVAYWVEDPSRYWHGTSMPNLRLSRVEAASVAKYLVSLETPPNHPAEVSAEEVALISDEAKRMALAPCGALGGRNVSRVDCGAKVIEERGCFGCHRIDGFEKFSAIGPELTGFAQKDITTLDYGYAISDHHMQTTETFSALKMDSPRIFARDRIVLKMGDFDFSAEEIRALTVFLRGTVASKPAENFDPMRHREHAAAVRGRQLVNDLNCRGCHMIEGRGADIDGWRLQLLTQDPQRRAPFLDGEGARVQPEWLFSFLRDPGKHGIRPWLHPDWAYGDDVPDDKRALRMPTFNLSAEQWTDIVRYFSTWDRQPYPFEVPQVKELASIDKHWALANMNSKDTGNCMSCHYYESFPVERARGDLKKMAPDFAEMKRRLRPEWVKQWLLRPHNYLPYTSMTAFFASVDRDKENPWFARESDPFLSPPPKGWQEIIEGMRPLTTEQHAEVLRDFIYSIPDGAPWPDAGKESTSVMVDPNAAALAETEAAAVPPGEQPGG